MTSSEKELTTNHFERKEPKQMKLLVTTNARLYKTQDGKYWTSLVYGYDFFTRYLNVFETIKLVAHVKELKDEDTDHLLRVDGPNMSVFEIPFPHGKKEYIKQYFKIQRQLKSAVDGCDAALLRIPDQLAFQVFGIVRRKKIPVAIEVTTDSWELMSPKWGRYPLRPLIRTIWHLNQKWCCKNADGVSYVTETSLQKRYPHGIKPETHRFTTHYTSAALNIEDYYEPRRYLKKDSFVLLHVATSLSFITKGHKELVEAFIRLRQEGFGLQLCLIGAGSLAPNVQALVDASGYSEDITTPGLIKKQKLKEIFCQSDIFVFPSYSEGLPRVVIEAMASGLPCVCTNLPGIRELIDENMLVPTKSVSPLVEKIRYLITNPVALEEQCAKNFYRSQNFSTKIIEKKRTSFYSKLYQLSDK